MTTNIWEQPGLTKSQQTLAKHMPESLIGGFSRKNSTFIFYSLINSVVQPEHTILDYGAGRGAQNENDNAFRRSLLNFKGKVAHVAGVDVDPAIMSNPMLDEKHVIEPGGRLPFADASFDVIFSDWVIEHVDDPVSFTNEAYRVLKPGGWFFGRTPNRYGAIAIAATLVPNERHSKVLSKLQPERKVVDIFPTRYRLNTLRKIAKYFPAERFDNFSFTLDTELQYLLTRPILFSISEAVGRVLPSVFQPVLIAALRKRA